MTLHHVDQRKKISLHHSFVRISKTRSGGVVVSFGSDGAMLLVSVEVMNCNMICLHGKWKLEQ